MLRNSENPLLFRKSFRNMRTVRQLCASWLICDTRYDLATNRPQCVARVPYLGCSAGRAFSCRLLNRVGTAAGAGRTVLALFELEGQHIEQAIDPVGERFEQGLLFKRRDVEMKTKEVDERSAAQTALLDDRAPCLVRGLAQVAEEHLAQRVHRLRIAIERVGPHRTPCDLGLPIRTIANLAEDTEFTEALEHQVVAAVG